MPKQKCRLCLVSMYKMESIFSTTQEIQNAQLAQMLFGIEVHSDDKLSKKICHNCIQLLNYVYTNKMKFQQNQQILENDVNKSGNLPKGTVIRDTAMESWDNSDEEPLIVKDANKNKKDRKYLRINENDLTKLCTARVILTRLEDSNLLVRPQNRHIKHTKRKLSDQIYGKNRKLLLTSYYYNKKTQCLRHLMAERFHSQNRHSRSLHEDDLSYRISTESRNKTCSIEKWHDCSDDLLQINMEHNVFVCPICCRMYSTKWTLRVHEQSHMKKLQEVESDSRPSSPLTII